MCESAISCFLLNQVSDVFHLKHQKCENVISHIKILTFVSDGWQSEIRSKNVVLNYFLSLTEVLQPPKTSKHQICMSV